MVTVCPAFCLCNDKPSPGPPPACRRPCASRLFGDHVRWKHTSKKSRPHVGLQSCPGWGLACIGAHLHQADPPAERSTANRHPSDGALVVPVSGLNKSLHSWSERLGGVGPSKQLRNTPGTPHRTTHPSEPISQLGWAGLASRSPVWASCLSRSALIDSPSSVLQNAVSTARSCDAFLKGGGKQFASPHRQARLVLRPDACFPVFLHTSSV